MSYALEFLRVMGAMFLADTVVSFLGTYLTVEYKKKKEQASKKQ